MLQNDIPENTHCPNSSPNIYPDAMHFDAHTDQGVIHHMANTLVAFSSSNSNSSSSGAFDRTQLLRFEPGDAASLANSFGSDSVEAYAKLQGPNWTYYVQKLSINLGRTLEPRLAGSLTPYRAGPDVDAIKQDMLKPSAALDVHLGDHDEISRRHLRLDYNFNTQLWELSCFGKSGVLIDGVRYEPFCPPIPLEAGSEIRIGDCVSFTFTLPGESFGDDSSSDISGAPHASLQTPVNSRMGSPNEKERKLKVTLLLNKSHSISRSPSINDLSFGNEQKGPQPSHYQQQQRRRSGEPIKRPNSAVTEADMSLSAEYSTKPPHSYAFLISEAINSVPERRMTLNGIYNYLTDNYPYFRYTKNGWQNSVRHNLSLNKAFRKIPRSPTEPGKGMFWAIDDAHSYLIGSSNGGTGSQFGEPKKAKTASGTNASLARSHALPPVSATPPPMGSGGYASYYQSRMPQHGQQAMLPVMSATPLDPPSAGLQYHAHGAMMHPAALAAHPQAAHMPTVSFLAAHPLFHGSHEVALPVYRPPLGSSHAAPPSEPDACEPATEATARAQASSYSAFSVTGST